MKIALAQMKIRKNVEKNLEKTLDLIEASAKKWHKIYRFFGIEGSLGNL